MATQKKTETIEILKEKFQKAKSMIFTDYQGLKHKQLEELRKNLAKTDSELSVVKNKLFERAVGAKASDFKEYLKNSTAIVFAYKDEVAPLKELKKFFKAANLGATKGGTLGDQVLTNSQVDTLAGLPPKQALLGQLAGQLNAPIQSLHYALSWNMNRLVWVLDGIKNIKSN
jgi:large subunit ribosomal protein L10